MAALAALVLIGSLPLAAQIPPPLQVRHATYDFTEGSYPGDSNLNLKEVWVDTKTPGDGYTYSVGTVEVRRVIPGPANPLPVLFSGSAVSPVDPLGGFDQLASVEKQVIILQCVRSATQEIVWQRFYYGYAEDGSRHVNARAISVWAAPDGVGTRIAICGESTCNALPLDQFNSPTGGFGSGDWRGFIAVFESDPFAVPDDQCVLKWSHQFYGLSAGSTNGDMAVTDVSLRVADGLDVVTYCGISTTGNAAPANAEKPFAAPTSTCSTATGGNGYQVSGNWDGFVGRITRALVAPTVVMPTVFHSAVGGRGVDALFGIAEMDENRFVVVGFTEGDQNPAPGPSFPFTATCLSATSQSYKLGVVLHFDASATASPTNGDLVLEWSEPIGKGPYDGAAAPYQETEVRDVAAVSDGPDVHRFAVVGSTDDSAFDSTVQPLHGGSSDGFLRTYVFIPFALVTARSWQTYFGGMGRDGLVGVAIQPESPDHVTVVGAFDQDTSGAGAIRVATYWLANAAVPGDPLPNPQGLLMARNVHFGGVATGPQPRYRAAATGDLNAGLGWCQGGGIAVDERGRVTAVGALVDMGPTYNASSAQPPLQDGRANKFSEEAYRAMLDMLPANCGRSDGTGVATGVQGAQYPVPGWFGGTTPECGLSALGPRIGDPAPALGRMLIDYIGGDPADGQRVTICVDRPPSLAGTFALWQIGFPGLAVGVSPQPSVLDNSVIIWAATDVVVSDPVTTVDPLNIYGVGNVGGSVAQTFDLPNLPLGQTEIVTVQLLCLLNTPVPGGSLGPNCTGTTNFAASPGLWFSYTGQ